MLPPLKKWLWSRRSAVAASALTGCGADEEKDVDEEVLGDEEEEDARGAGDAARRSSCCCAWAVDVAAAVVVVVVEDSEEAETDATGDTAEKKKTVRGGREREGGLDCS